MKLRSSVTGYVQDNIVFRKSYCEIFIQLESYFLLYFFLPLIFYQVFLEGLIEIVEKFLFLFIGLKPIRRKLFFQLFLAEVVILVFKVIVISIQSHQVPKLVHIFHYLFVQSILTITSFLFFIIKAIFFIYFFQLFFSEVVRVILLELFKIFVVNLVKILVQLKQELVFDFFFIQVLFEI